MRIPANTIYNNDAWSSAPPTMVYTTTEEYPNGLLMWEHGAVGFDSSVVITFSVTVTPGYEGTVLNSAVISDPMIAEPVEVLAQTSITDRPVFEISKSADPAILGANKPLTYELVVTNQGQATENTPITVTDFIPTDTTFITASLGGTYNPDDRVVYMVSSSRPWVW